MAPEPLKTHQGVFRRTTIALALLGFCVAWHSSAMADEFRTWSDSTGKFKIKAKFVEVSDGKVTLEQEDGTQVKIPLEKLSEPDRKVAAEMQANEESPFKVSKPATKPAKKAAKKKTADEESDDQDETDAEGDAAKVVKVRWSGVKQILPNPASDKWSLSIDVPEQKDLPKGRPVAFPGKRDFFEHIKGPAINPVCRRAVVGYILDKDKGQTRVILCDLESGKVLGQGKTAGRMAPLALNDAGTQVLMCRDEFGFGNHDRLETWTIGPAGISKVLEWIPHDDQKGGERDIRWARYIGEEKLLTDSGGGKLTLWNAATAKPLYWLKVNGYCFPALSPDRKYAAFVTDKEIGMLDLGAGEVVALQPAPREHFGFPVLAFTPKGTRLACGAFDRLYVWDVATGAMYREIPLAGGRVAIGDNLLCPSEEHILVGNHLLIDIESQAKIWSYHGHEGVGMLGGTCWFEVVDKESGALVPAVLPQPSAVEKIQKAVESPDFFVLKPGATVKLNVSGLADLGEREKAAAALTQKLQANGCQVGANGVVELVATTEAGKPREVAYRTFGRPVARAYTVQEFHSHVKVVYQGQTAWDVSCSSLSGFVRLKEGETMEQYLKRSEHPNYEWFSQVELPKVVQKPTSGTATLGTTQVTTAGVR